MAQQQQIVNITAPGQQGINTEDSPYNPDTTFCLQADNAVLDQFGRLGSRKGFADRTTTFNLSTFSAHPQGAETKYAIGEIHTGYVSGQFETVAMVRATQLDSNGAAVQTDFYFCVEAGAVLTEITAPYTLNTTHWDAQIVTFNDNFYIFSDGNPALAYDGSTLAPLFTGVADTDYILPQDDTGVISTNIDGDIACAAFGRLWVSGVGDDYQRIYYSDLLIPTQWYDGRANPVDAQNTGGLIDLREYWPTGFDTVQNIVVHNGFLIVFGRQSILVWANPQGDPAGTPGISLNDTVSSIGLVARDALTSIGSDLLFVDDTGVRSLGRTIQEKSVAIGDLTKNVRRDVVDQILGAADKRAISLQYLPEEDVTVLLFSHTAQAYVLDMRVPSSTGGARITRWTGCNFRRMHAVENRGLAYTIMGGQDAGILEYEGTSDSGSTSYEFKYKSTILTFGQPTREKFMKEVDYRIVTSVGFSGAIARWGHDGVLNKSRQLSIVGSTAAQYSIAQFGVDEFGDEVSVGKRYRVNVNGSGNEAVVGFDGTIDGAVLLLQEINVKTLIGRIY